MMKKSSKIGELPESIYFIEEQERTLPGNRGSFLKKEGLEQSSGLEFLIQTRLFTASPDLLVS